MKESIKCAKTVKWNLIPDDFKKKFYNSSEKDKNEDSNIFALHVHTPECENTQKMDHPLVQLLHLTILSQLTSIPIRNDVT